MLQPIKIFCMFVVLDTLKNNQDATNISRTETKLLGRRTVASTAVLSKHRFGVSSSDLPSFYHNQTFSVMLDKKGQSKEQYSNCIGEILSLNKISKQHDLNRQSLIKSLNNRPKEELIDDFIVEMDAKNQAYYFILENGLFMQFRDYCLTPKTATL